MSLTHATFPAGYRSVPHAHESEELAQLIEGELSVFLDGLEFKLREGDFIRVPALAVHWKRNHSAGPAVLLELHNPPRGGGNGGSLLDAFEREDASFGGAPRCCSARPTAPRATTPTVRTSFPEAPADNPLLARGADVWRGVVPTSSEPQPRQHRGDEDDRASAASGWHAARRADRLQDAAALPRRRADQLRHRGRGLDVHRRSRVLLAAGDFVRVPGNVVHWAMVEPGKTAFTFEVHTPLAGRSGRGQGHHLARSAASHPAPRVDSRAASSTTRFRSRSSRPTRRGCSRRPGEPCSSRARSPASVVKPTGARR